MSDPVEKSPRASDNERGRLVATAALPKRCRLPLIQGNEWIEWIEKVVR